MSRLIHTAQTKAIPAAGAVKRPRNSFTSRPADLSSNGHFDEVKRTRFDYFAHQPVWTHSRMSCPPESPARILEEEDQFDDIAKYAIGDLGFVSNWTAMSDICLSPSLSSTYGFFDRPNAYGVVHDLFPIFSQSKISSYADILYPSPWYWADKVPYSAAKDPAWDKKQDRLYWRGSTTGGYSRDGGWRRQHRQRFVQKINAPDKAKILTPPSSLPPPPSPSSSSTPTKPTTKKQQEQQQQQQQQQQQSRPPQQEQEQKQEEQQQKEQQQQQQQQQQQRQERETQQQEQQQQSAPPPPEQQQQQKQKQQQQQHDEQQQQQQQQQSAPPPPEQQQQHNEQQQQQQQQQGEEEEEEQQRPQHQQQQQQQSYEPEQWTVREVPRGNYKSLLDVYFSHVGQCDPGDCDAQRAFFEVKDYAKQEDALEYKHVLDMDGNAFSGRFYALLRSRSLVYKWAIFREWHYEWLRPWVHFVPLSLHGEEWLETVRFFNSSGRASSEGGSEDAEVPKERKEGAEEAERMAQRGRDWAGKVLRNEDLEVWFFRLLLEYGRVIDDDRENIGYAG
ncbi:glycosyltransferase family 90 protein [Thermothelomyces thermophilus ATCC 42464]|uniref:Glycosyltransferase family 90 protein n=1 Tax=Thermothelomyces thermophilus (strain ATCC 42464 / BCRC 31852 / DSM 1799) TaxID=573729 RepID=G2QDL0_THET4|nr:glycosyltransferase family 90 protein [Thermothelomyces thermophilus ATCC 42464]AEO57522.1 glycosyltransferase family 90 protein [Thermothelomyces thermophilus ATCC 42464]